MGERRRKQCRRRAHRLRLQLQKQLRKQRRPLRACSPRLLPRPMTPFLADSTAALISSPLQQAVVKTSRKCPSALCCERPRGLNRTVLACEDVLRWLRENELILEATGEQYRKPANVAVQTLQERLSTRAWHHDSPPGERAD